MKSGVGLFCWRLPRRKETLSINRGCWPGGPLVIAKGFWCPGALLSNRHARSILTNQHLEFFVFAGPLTRSAMVLCHISPVVTNKTQQHNPRQQQ